MNLVKSFEQLNFNNIFLSEPIKNNIINDGNFIRILYSNDIVSFNGIYLLVNLKNVICEKFYNKYKYSFDINDNKETIYDLKIIEENILKKYNSDKIPSFKIYDLLQLGYIKIYDYIENKSKFNIILKISGIWVNDMSYGITYKFSKSKQIELI